MSIDNQQSRLVVIVMGVQGLGILGVWGAYAIGGAFKDGIRTVENNMFLGIHLLAETMMGLLLIAGSAGTLMDRSWGQVVGSLGLGAVVYSTVNSLADTLRNKPRLTPILVVNLVVALMMAAMLARRLDRTSA